MARVAKIKGTASKFSTLVVVPNTVEYTFTETEENGIRVTPVILGKVQNSAAYEIPGNVLAHLGVK